MYNKKKGLFIVLEGIDGSGKTHHGKKLYLRLKKNNLPVEYTREPGGTKTSESIRKIILNNKKINRRTETFLYFACRSEHLEKKIYPFLKKNKIVICDRFLDSTLAYQGAGFGIDKKTILAMQHLIAKRLKPDLTILLKLNSKYIKTRLINRRSNNKYDFLNKKFYKIVNNAFSNLSKKGKYLVVNSSISRAVNEGIIFDKVMNIIKKNMELEENLNFNDPFYQFKLFNYNKYFAYLDNLNKKKILPQVNLISGPAGYGKQTFIFHFINYLLSSDKDDKYNYSRKEISRNNIDYKLMLEGIHPNFYFLDSKEKKKSIEIDQVREINKYLQNTSFNKSIKYIMINNCEKLNSSSSNALLKILEEPRQNNFFFLIYDNSEFLLNTIKSRCIQLKINFNDSEKIEIINELCLLHIKNFNQNYFDKEINDFYIGSPGLIFNYIKYKHGNDEIKDENNKHLLLDYFVVEYLKSKENHLLKIIYLLLENIFYAKIKDNKSNIKLYMDRKNTFKKLNLMNSLNLDEKNIFQEIKGIIANV